MNMCALCLFVPESANISVKKCYFLDALVNKLNKQYIFVSYIFRHRKIKKKDIYFFYV